MKISPTNCREHNLLPGECRLEIQSLGKKGTVQIVQKFSDFPTHGGPVFSSWDAAKKLVDQLKDESVTQL